jgi:hypothetical protein
MANQHINNGGNMLIPTMSKSVMLSKKNNNKYNTVERYVMMYN